ncbi:hypothetical protein [Aliivibrio kagoshimensis]|jgi:hypothetical protein|uniref:hypothetical protein n=1 Tax=Aliivibrio kagoshimensis TaxID=2910230 RepID=UPI003D0A4C0A
MNRFLAISPKSQCTLFAFAFCLNLLAMVLTDMWLPMVVGAIITMGLFVDSWARFYYITPLKKELEKVNQQMSEMRKLIQDKPDY